MNRTCAISSCISFLISVDMLLREQRIAPAPIIHILALRVERIRFDNPASAAQD
jgi:hypothetical protein